MDSIWRDWVSLSRKEHPPRKTQNNRSPASPRSVNSHPFFLIIRFVSSHHHQRRLVWFIQRQSGNHNTVYELVYESTFL